jgi:Domain of unknown function (DUF4082)
MDVRVRHIVITLSVFALAALTGTQAASATGTNVQGLWSSTYTAAQTDCGRFARDINNFCWTEGGDSSLGGAGPGVELGVKFTSSQSLNITGVRVYRVSPGTVTGELWDGAGGTPLATGTFDDSVTHGWQDLMFSSPVPIQAGHTYVASYHVADAQYALEYGFFTNSADTVGPITALSSPDSGGNGVYCYDHDPCAVFPVNTYQDTNYWVTPLWGYNFSGFFQRVDNTPTMNVAKAGSAVPVKFSLGGDQGLDIFQPGYPKVTTVSCSTSAPTDPIETTVTASNSALQYDPTTDQYTYVWKTNSTSAGACMQFDLGLNDGSTHTFLVQLKK